MEPKSRIRKFVSTLKNIVLEIDNDSREHAMRTKEKVSETHMNSKRNFNNEMMQYYVERRKMYESIDSYTLGLKYGTIHYINDNDFPPYIGDDKGNELLLFVDDSKLYGFINGIPVHHYELGYYMGKSGDDNHIFKRYTKGVWSHHDKDGWSTQDIIAQDIIAWTNLPALSMKYDIPEEYSKFMMDKVKKRY